MDELCESEIDNGFLQRPRRNIRDTTGSGGENGMIILNLCEHINGAEIRRIEKRACQQSSINDRVGRWMSDKRRALNLRHRNLCLMFKGISPQAWSRQITRVLAMAPVHKRNASFRILCNGFRRLGDSIPYSITDLTSDRYTVSNGRLPAPQDVPFDNLITSRRSRHIAATFCICGEVWTVSLKRYSCVLALIFQWKLGTVLQNQGYGCWIVFLGEQHSSRFGAREFKTTFGPTSCTLLLKSVDTADFRGLNPNHIPRSINHPCITQQEKWFTVGDHLSCFRGV